MLIEICSRCRILAAGEYELDRFVCFVCLDGEVLADLEAQLSLEGAR